MADFFARSASLRAGLRRKEKSFSFGFSLRGPEGPLFHQAPIKKEAAFFCGLSSQSTDYKSYKPFYWQADGDPPANESQNLARGAPPAAPVAGIVIVCSVKTPLFTVPPFGTMSEG